MSGLIWVQVVCKDNQQTTQSGKVLNNGIMHSDTDYCFVICGLCIRWLQLSSILNSENQLLLYEIFYRSLLDWQCRQLYLGLHSLYQTLCQWTSIWNLRTIALVRIFSYNVNKAFYTDNVFVTCFCLREHSGSTVECLTQDWGAAGSSLTSVTVLWSLSKTHLS